MSLVDSLKSSDSKTIAGDTPQGSYQETGITRYNNPQMSWYERWFCRGYQRSGFCSYKTLHPFREVWDANGIRVREAKPKRKGAIRYRGRLGGNRALHGKMTLNELAN